MSDLVEKKVVFISGPSDALEEMILIRKVIRSLDKVYCPRLGLTLEPAMGETHAPAGVGRPQGRINPWVEICGLFIGVFIKQLGTPTGDYQSGSEEEFRLAFNRSQQSPEGQPNVPEIILFFRELSQDDYDSVDAQLQALLNFKENIRLDLLYKSFDDERDLIIKCYEQVIQWINTNVQGETGIGEELWEVVG